MRWVKRGAAMLAVVGLAVGLTGCATPAWQKQLASVNAAGTDAGNLESRFPVLSPDGTRVLFESEATDLGPNDTNGVIDLYVRDLATGVTSLVSANAAGTDSGNASARGWAWSPDGTKVAFMSRATNLTSPPITGVVHENVFVRDLMTGTTSLITEAQAGQGDPNDQAVASAFSPDGSRLLYSYSPYQPSGGGPAKVYERDLTTGVVTEVGDGTIAAYSPSGTAVAFLGGGEVWLRDLSTGALTWLSSGLLGSTNERNPSFSPDGTKVALKRKTEVNDRIHEDIYVHDLVTGTNTLVTVGMNGGGANTSWSTPLGFDPADGNQFLFSSRASNLVANDNNGSEDVFVRNLVTGVTTLVSVNGAGTGSGSHAAMEGRFLGSTHRVAFLSHAHDLGPNDTNSYLDVYVRDLVAGTTTLVSTNAAGDNGGNGNSGQWTERLPLAFLRSGLSVSADGSRIAFGSDANNLGPADSGAGVREHDIYVATAPPP